MDWQRDPQTGEWVAIDPWTQGTTGQELDPSLRDPLPSLSGGPEYSNPDLRPLPSSRDAAPSRDYAVPPDNAGGYSDPGLRPMPLAPDANAGYQNYDPNAYAAWAQGVEERGNEVRETAVGCFEVDAGGRIVSRAPSPYPVN